MKARFNHRRLSPGFPALAWGTWSSFALQYSLLLSRHVFKYKCVYPVIQVILQKSKMGSMGLVCDNDLGYGAVSYWLRMERDDYASLGCLWIYSPLIEME